MGEKIMLIDLLNNFQDVNTNYLKDKINILLIELF
jgi:hypothetical protein